MKIWGFLCFLALLAAGFYLLTEVPKENGDPVLCKWCWIGGHHHHASEERSPVTSLKTLGTAQADFRANDRDGDKIAQFWRADVAGLYALVPKGGEAIKLIELSVAAADDRPVMDMSKYALKAPKNGYWFRAIRHVEEDPKAPDPDRFAYCAFPDTPSAGKWIYIIDEDNMIYRAEAQGRRGIEVFPSEEELKKQWAKIG
jgi:hypothetical protein